MQDMLRDVLSRLYKMAQTSGPVMMLWVVGGRGGRGREEEEEGWFWIGCVFRSEACLPTYRL